MATRDPTVRAARIIARANFKDLINDLLEEQAQRLKTKQDEDSEYLFDPETFRVLAGIQRTQQLASQFNELSEIRRYGVAQLKEMRKNALSRRVIELDSNGNTKRVIDSENIHAQIEKESECRENGEPKTGS